MKYQAELVSQKKDHEFMICFDSDGCVFDTMELKQKECFTPAFIKHFGLQSIAKYARETWEFVNLYSATRGGNRFLALDHVLKLLSGRPEVKSRHVALPTLPELEQWIAEEGAVDTSTLKQKVAKIGSAEFLQLQAWSDEVNERIHDMVHNMIPFPGVEDVLKKAKNKADMMVISLAPLETLMREWRENDISNYFNVIAGQEHGLKADILQTIRSEKKYGNNRMLMIGDAMGDLNAAKRADALFFPIIPGKEEASWITLFNEGLDHFFNDTYAGTYQAELLDEFNKALPVEPVWGHI